MRFPIFLSSMVLLASCASGIRRPESFTDKMNRYKAIKYSDNKVPEISLPGNLVTASRGPASVAPSNAKNEKSLSVSNKRLYFLTLHSQYKKLNQMVGSKAPQVNVCPSFHTSLVKQKNDDVGKTVSPIDFKSINYSNENNFYAEAYLPITRNSLKPTVKDVINKEGSVVVEKALEIHLSKTYSELQELCEFGNSDNYYTYENLYSLIQMGKMNNAQDKMSALMKTTVFSNHVLIKSLSRNINKGRVPASANADSEKPLIKEVFQRFQSPVTDQQLDRVVR